MRPDFIYFCILSIYLICLFHSLCLFVCFQAVCIHFRLLFICELVQLFSIIIHWGDNYLSFYSFIYCGICLFVYCVLFVYLFIFSFTILCVSLISLIAFYLLIHLMCIINSFKYLFIHCSSIVKCTVVFSPFPSPPLLPTPSHDVTVP